METRQSDYFLATPGVPRPPPPPHTPCWQAGFKAKLSQELFILDLCLFNAGFYGSLCTSLSPCVARSAWSKGIFFTGYLVTLFFSTISVQNHHLLKSRAFGHFPSLWTWRHPWCDGKIPGGFSLHLPQQSHTVFTPTLYSSKLIIWEEEQPANYHPGTHWDEMCGICRY